MDEQQKQDFAARLQRIQAQKAIPVEPPELPEIEVDGDGLPPLPPVPPQGGGGSGFGPIRSLMILLTLLALGGFGGMYFLETTNGAQQVAEAPVTAQPEEGQEEVALVPVPRLLAFNVPRAEPKQPGRREVTDRGWAHTRGSVATPDGAQVRVGDIADGFEPAQPLAAPSEIIPFKANDGCTLRRPQGDEIVRNVRFGYANAETDLHAFSNAAVADAVKDHAKAALFKPKSYEVGKTATGRLNQVDVFVTDTSGPVYLVLQTLWGNTLWNVHRGQGVRIAHIAIIGQTSGIVAPEGVSFEALRISDFVTDFEFGAHDEIRPCMIAPYRLPKPDWEAQKKALKDNDLYENQMYSFNTGHRAFAAWYEDVLGVDPETGLTEAEAAGHALVGPVPPGLLGYRSLAGRAVHVTEAEHLLIGDAAVAEVHRALILAAAGGDVATILPPMRRATP